MKDEIQSIRPELTLQQIEQIITIVCAVSKVVCPVPTSTNVAHALAVTSLYNQVKDIHPNLSLLDIGKIISLICSVSDTVCPAFAGGLPTPPKKKGFARSYKEFAPHLTTTSLLPHQVSTAYNFPTGLDLSKRSIAILELGGAFQIKDVIDYCNQHGYKVPTVTTLFVGNATALSSDADGEVSLDICVIAAVAQGVDIYVVFAENSEQGFIDGLKKCVDLNVDAVSISWGAPETSFSKEARAAMDKIMFDAANERGIAVFCASGDNGSKDGTLHDVCDYPSSSPYAISCGGTRLQLNADGTRGSETAWSTSLFNSSGTGGGISAAYPTTPDWQKNILPHEKAGRRSPDISGNADPQSGFQIEINGVEAQVGGTSAVSPLYSALFCMINETKGKHIGNLHTKMYEAPAECFFDVTKGKNGGFKEQEGYSCVTGLGVTVADKLLAHL